MVEPQRPLISVVTPCYNEENNVRECYERVRQVFASELREYEYEHVFCDNASSDRTVEILRGIAADDCNVKVILNARNYGPFRSTFNALLKTSGDAVVVMLAADLQDPPEVVPEMVRRWEQGYEVVYGIRANREEGVVMRNVRKLYYRMVNRFANIDIPNDVGEFQLVDKRIIEALRQCDDYYPYIRGMIANCGFRSTGVPYRWAARKRGLSKNRLYHLIDQGLNGIISFTNIPLRLCMFVGSAVAVVSLLFAFVTVCVKLFYLGRLTEPGIPTLITALFFFGGVQLFFLGLIGEYISAIHFQVRKRPLVLERESINFVSAAANRSALPATIMIEEAFTPSARCDASGT
jgi:glycosyltransferase involved in cell wall biosynthesis